MVRQAEALFKSMELAGQCKLDLMLVRETFEDKEAKLWYPVREEKVDCNPHCYEERTDLIPLLSPTAHN